MGLSSAIGAGGSILGGMFGQQGAKSAVNAESNMFNTASAYASPFINMGRKAINPLMSLITPGPNQNAALEGTPGYQFALSQGEKGVTNQATMGGLGGNVLRGGANYAEGLASNTWSDVVSKLMGTVGTGANAASSLAGNATNMAGTIGNTALAGTNLGVGGLLGAAGSASTGLSNLGTLGFLSKYMNNGGGGAPGAPGAPGMYSNTSNALQPQPWPD